MAKEKTLDEVLTELDVSVKAKLEKILANLTEQQRIAIIQNPALIDELLSDFNPDLLAQYYQTELLRYAGEIGIQFKNITDNAQKDKVNLFVETMLQLKTRTLRNYIANNKEQFADNLIKLIINGSDEQTVKEYFALTPFKNYQIGTLLNTARADIRRTATIAGFEDDENTRYRYVGPIVEHSSKICIWMLQNQRPEGYTLAEIQAGIKTPAGNVDFGGRIPNYNCLHEWEKIV